MNMKLAIAVGLTTGVFVASCVHSVTDKADVQPTSILMIGDTGYDYDWLDTDDYEDRFTLEQFVLKELEDWGEDKRPPAEFALPPIHFAEQTGGYVMASGMWPVSRAATDWCKPEGRCDFAVMLGDNIYPSGATMGADGRDDDARFRELLLAPYEGLRRQDPDFQVFAVLGNHDWETSREGAMLQLDYLEKSPLYYMDGISYRVMAAPDIEIFAIDTTVMLAGETVYKDELDASGAPVQTREIEPEVEWATPVGDEKNMVAWLENALAESDARWKIVIGHHPLWSSSGSKIEEAIVLRRLIRPMLCRYADAYLAGHDHMLEVHADDCSDEIGDDSNVPPLLNVVSGAAGKQRPQNSAFMRWQDETHPGKKSLYVRSLVWGYGELVVRGNEADVIMITTPNDGSGRNQVEFETRIARRSGKLPEVKK